MRGEALQQQIKKQQSNLQRTFRQSKTNTWQGFLNSATNDQVFQPLRYMKPDGQQPTNTLKFRSGEVEESQKPKEELINEEVFPKPLKGKEQKVQVEEGEIHQRIPEEAVSKAIFDHLVLNAPGSDSLEFQVIRVWHEWDSRRISAAVIILFGLQLHP